MLLASLLMLVLLPDAAIQGRVRADPSGDPIRHATIRIPELRRAVSADEQGYFVVSGVPAGRWRVQASAPGYRATEALVQVGVSGVVRLDFDLVPEPLPGRVGGQVADYRGTPLPGATVEVLGTFRRAEAQVNGEFALTLPSGSWRLRVSHVGYRPDTVNVEVGARAPDPVLVRLAPVPVELRGLTVEAARTPLLAQSVTTETVRQVPPLGEPDIFRAVVLLPGVSQPNDLKGRIHLAGGSSDETGIRLDGHPLQDPFHLLGLFGAFNVAALERADVLIHHLPASLGGRLSGVVDLRSRSPGASSESEVVAGLLASGLTLSRPNVGGGVDVLAAGRITYLDKIARLFSPSIPPLGFHDGLVRIGRSWGGGWRAEALGFTTRDFFGGGMVEGLVDVAEGEPLTWGESLAGVRIIRDAGVWELTGRASLNRARARMREPQSFGTQFIDSRRDWASGALEATRTAERWRIHAGLGVDHRSNRQAWSARGLIDELFSPNTPAEYQGSEDHTEISLFGDAARDLGDRWTATAGGRISQVGGGVYLDPRTQVSFRASERLRIQAALDRRHQFDAQLEEPIEGSITAPLFLLETPRRADVAALSLEWNSQPLPFAEVGTVQVQAFAKRYPDRPRLRELGPTQARDHPPPDFPQFDRFPGSSIGAMASRRLTWGEQGIVQGSYTYQRVREEYGGVMYLTAWDAPHTLALFGSTPLGRKWTLNTVYHAHSGRATTPVLARISEPNLRSPGTDFLLPRYLYGERNSIQVPPYHRLDLGARRAWQARGAEWVLSLQVLNVLFRENPVDYNWREYFARVDRVSGEPQAGRSGLPLLPSLGLEVRW